jgi:hypothetical protein
MEHNRRRGTLKKKGSTSFRFVKCNPNDGARKRKGSMKVER